MNSETNQITRTQSANPDSNAAGDKSGKSEGKISSLPRELQDYVAEQIQAGTRYRHIVKHLADAGYHDIYEHNITCWKHFGYKKWLLAKQRQSEREAERKQALELAQQENGGPPAALFYLAVSRMIGHLQRCDSQMFEEKAEKDPSVYLGLLRNVAWITRAGCGWLGLTRAKLGAPGSPNSIPALSVPLRKLIEDGIKLF